MKNKVPIEGKVTGINKGGFNVRIMGQKAFCPVSQIDLKYVEDQTKYLNASLSFVITRITEGGKKHCGVQDSAAGTGFANQTR